MSFKANAMNRNGKTGDLIEMMPNVRCERSYNRVLEGFQFKATFFLPQLCQFIFCRYHDYHPRCLFFYSIPLCSSLSGYFFIYFCHSRRSNCEDRVRKCIEIVFNHLVCVCVCAVSVVQKEWLNDAIFDEDENLQIYVLIFRLHCS